MDEATLARVRNWLARAREYLRAAEHEFNGEFYARSISTAYYAMFYAATAALTSIGVSRARHSGVESAFGEYFVRTGKINREVGQLLSRAREDREESDYDEIPVMGHDSAHTILDYARRFVREVAAYLAGQGLTDESP
ncbi:MAG: HEPN domain-containing protein [Chloroflexi bacterium]|nr:HEPN domain-containing protein [Chloroflexota bacterium]